MDPVIRLSERLVLNHSDITRFVVIFSFTMSVTIVVVLAMAGPAAMIAPQLYFFPILYACYHYPKSGLWMTGACAVVYEFISILFSYPAVSMTVFAIGQAVLFIGIGAVVAYISDQNLRFQARINEENERRRGVITTVAHELRTPLQPLMGYLNLLLQDPDDFGIRKETAVILNRCLASVERERQIINQMLEYSVLDSGKLHLEYSVFSARDIIVSLISERGYGEKAEIITDVPAEVTFAADAERISLVIDSMLSNAIAFSRPPRRIRIAYVSLPGDTYHRLAITDNGIGISEIHFESIFEPFQLADANRLSRKFERIGLSLPIAKKYIEMHGGYISVQSRVNEGSTFTINIPKHATYRTGGLV
jgi:signal transduction histidine kinase